MSDVAPKKEALDQELAIATTKDIAKNTLHEDRDDSLCRKATAPARRFNDWFTGLTDVYGLRFVIFIIFGIHLLKGFLTAGGGGGLLIIENLAYLELQVGASTKSILSAVSASGWSLKPMFGLISDTLVIAGYRRTPWVIITSVVATGGYLCIFTFGRSLKPVALCLCFFAVRTQIAWTDLMVEAAYTTKMRENPEHAVDIVTWVWSGIGIATIAGVLVAGPGTEFISPFAMSGLCIPIAAAILIPASLGWMGEQPRESPKCGIDRVLIMEHSSLFLCTTILACAVLTSNAVAISSVPFTAKVGVTVGGATAAIGSGIWCLPEGLWRPMLFMFLSSAMSIDTTAFVDNFYLDPGTLGEATRTGYPMCVDCPHFSKSFYIATVGICDSVFVVLGSSVFNAYMSNWTYRRALVTTQMLSTAVSLVDVVQFMRWNRRWGIPDGAFMLGKHAVGSTCGMLNFMPMAILTSKLCPKSVESTVFALLAGFSNFGGVVSKYLGASALELIGMGNIGKGPVDDFQNAWKACLINACAPLLVLVLMPLLVPDARISDPLEASGNVEATSTTEESSTKEEGTVSDEPEDSLRQRPCWGQRMCSLW